MPQAAVVSFVVPCYNLAHFLAECVGSILLQSYSDIEILIINDQSPDNTSEVANEILSSHSPGSRRLISYILNEENLGNIRTYNRGIRLARGAYVWILSPDDRLRSPDIVAKYVALMEANPEIGYTFCPGHLIDNDNDTGVYLRSQNCKEESVLDGHEILKEYVRGKFELLAPSVMVRKKCYEQISVFPEDLPHRGDTYVWALIAMRNKVGYFAEAMVDYRVHSNSMISTLARHDHGRIIQDDVAVLWRVRAVAEKQSFPDIARYCLDGVVKVYATALLRTGTRGYVYRLTVKEFEASLSRFESSPIVRFKIRAKVFRTLLLSIPLRSARKLWRSVWPSVRSAKANA